MQELYIVLYRWTIKLTFWIFYLVILDLFSSNIAVPIANFRDNLEYLLIVLTIQLSSSSKYTKL